jgi:iron(III) transport system permease protein
MLENIEKPSLEAFSRLSFKNYIMLWSGADAIQWQPPLGRALLNTLFVAFVVAMGVMILSLLTAWFVVRSRLRFSRYLDLISFLPHAVPSIVIALATLILYVKLTWLPVYGTIWIIIIALASKRLSYGARTMISAMLQLHKELEEAAETSGIGWLTRLRLVTLRLLMPAFINGWLYSAMLSISMLAIPLVLYSKGNVMLSVVVFKLWNNADTELAASVSVITVLIMLVTVAIGRYLASKTGVRSEEAPV